ncbi:uncharacterized protein N7498_005966 [Penicillium cinerascens]|uniref:Uncharacterized protein n=1 Tax=Penicillium cinerascens TaxID=70096 RepID=A0A9W9MPS0_9EURO|nr:uncharacterized protein N7498_005966 [Penicillium cinerascens]KAJ5205087.1 hypothetical protein N7498_005966 [Penicillium cinerascens]
MSDFFRRASDALHHRQRQGSTDSTDAPKSPNAAKPPEPEPLNQKSESAQPDSHVNEAFAGTATDNVAHPKQRRHWGWGHYHVNGPEAKQQSSQEQKDDTDWVVGS